MSASPGLFLEPLSLGIDLSKRDDKVRAKMRSRDHVLGQITQVFLLAILRPSGEITNTFVRIIRAFRAGGGGGGGGLLSCGEIAIKRERFILL